jgi:hypothetical protein
VTELHERALSETGKDRFQFPSGLWLPLGLFDAAQRNYRVITFWCRCRGVKVAFSLGEMTRFRSDF